MANREHVDRIKQGVAAWNAWRDANPAIPPDLSIAHLSNAVLKQLMHDDQLSGANLRGVNMVGTILEGANLSGANLANADLRGANLERASLTDANLEGAILSSAKLEGTNLSGTNLSGANLRGTILRDANLSGANLRGSILRGANLRGAYLEGARLEGADLTDAILPDGFSPFSLVSAVLTGTEAVLTTGTGAVLTDAITLPSILAPLTGVLSPVDFTVSEGLPILAKPSADVRPIFNTPIDRRDHKPRLDLCRATAGSLLEMLEQRRFNVREGYKLILRDYIKHLPQKTVTRNLLFADQEARILRDLFAEDASVLPVEFASRLKALLQAHMALRVLYPVVQRFYDDVRFGRSDPLPIDAAEKITAIVKEAPEIFDHTVGQALADAAPPLPGSSTPIPANEPRTLEPPPDLLGTLPTEKAQGYLRAGVINRLFAAFLKGKDLNKNSEAWAKMGERLIPHVRPIIEWLSNFLSSQPPTG